MFTQMYLFIVLPKRSSCLYFRFSPEEKAKRDPFHYTPFGQGPRNCIAVRFALTEVKVAAAHILSQFTIRKGKDTVVSI